MPDEIVTTTAHPICQCVDLKATSGREFRYTMDKAYDAERPEFRSVERAWLMRIPCKAGFIAPHGGRRLSAYSATRRRALAELSCVTVAQGGDGCPEVLVVFNVDDLPTVAALLGARRPRRLSPEVLAASRARLEAIRKARQERTFSPLETTIGVGDRVG